LKLFVDTWGWLALADSDEPRHQEAVLCYRERARLTGGILTCNFVLDEFLTILFSRRPFADPDRFTKALVGSALVTVEQVSEKRSESALNLRRTLTDKPGFHSRT
jgi:predicted nucleic acid-binding protein